MIYNFFIVLTSHCLIYTHFSYKFIYYIIITIDIPSDFSGKITIENNNLTNDNNHKNIDKKIFSNNSLLYKNISYNNDELIIKQIYIKKLERSG